MSNHYTIEIDASHVARPDNDTATRQEIAGILRDLAERMETGRPAVGKLWNGDGREIGASYWSD